jgi:hypothetical protein
VCAYIACGTAVFFKKGIIVLFKFQYNIMQQSISDLDRYVQMLLPMRPKYVSMADGAVVE